MSATDAPKSYRAQEAAGWVLFQLGKSAEAIRAYDRAIAYAPVRWEVRNHFADQLRDHGNDSLALPELEASLAEAPAQSATRAALVADLIALGRYDEAMRLSNSSVRLAPAVFRGLSRLTDSAKRAGAPPEAVRIYITTRVAAPLP